MNRTTLARGLLSFVLLFGSGMSFVLDWSGNHLLNPLWHPHAKFHSAILLFFFAGVAITATWLLWQHSLNPRIVISAAVALSASYWTPFFFVPFLLPGSSYWAGVPGHEPHLFGSIFYPNLAVISLFLLLTAIAWWLGNARPQADH